MSEENEENDYETFLHDSLTDINYENVSELQIEEESNIAETGTEITAETEKSTVSSQAHIWEYFEKKTDEENNKPYILCLTCQHHFSAKNSTTTLERHLKSRHPDVFEQFKKGIKIRLELWSIEVQKEKHNLFINWVITDQQPFTIVENQDFNKFMASIQPNYKLPSRHIVKDMIMKKFENAQAQINNYLQLSTSKFSLTMDMWTSITSLGILAITIHFVNENWQFDHFVLDVLYIPAPHNSLIIQETIIRILSELNIANRLIGITTDNKAKMIAATKQIGTTLNLPGFHHYRCIAHILNLVVEAALDASIVPEPIKKLRIFISTVRNSPKQMDKLKEYFQVEGVNFKVPLPDCVTRWNYTYFMIDRAIEIKPLLSHLVSSLPTLNNNWPTEEEWHILTELANLLAPFALVTKVISASNYPTIGEAKMLFTGVISHLNQVREDDYILKLQVNEMNRVFTKYFDQINKALHVPAFFDPRYKKLAYGNMSQDDILRPIRLAMSNYEESTNISTPSQPIIQTSHQLTNLSAIETRNYFRTLLMPSQNLPPITNELNTYYDSNPPGDEVNPLEWWKNHTMEYPILSKMAKDYLSIMSTSVPCEQFFSVAGKQITQTRNRMHPETARACLSLKSWLEQGKIE